MSVETIAVICSALGLLIGFIGMIGWQMGRTDAQFKRLEDTLTSRIDRLATRLDGVEHELVEVKIGLARLEGLPRQLLPVR